MNRMTALVWIAMSACSSVGPHDAGVDAGAGDAGRLARGERCEGDQKCAAGLECVFVFDCGDNSEHRCEPGRCDAGPRCGCNHADELANSCVATGTIPTACAGVPETSQLSRLKAGVWMGPGMVMELTADGGRIEVSCASATISEPPLFGAPACSILGTQGCHGFTWRGTYSPADGGPSLPITIEGSLPSTVGLGGTHWVNGTMSATLRTDAGVIVQSSLRSERNCRGCHAELFEDAGIQCP